mmetsp:Transcript_15377/g.29228  ORF Transcript_15377/g.29228 Transcript_15377/m.29228 type:complete len:113 (-) Transcript_15377:476-814(-)
MLLATNVPTIYCAPNTLVNNPIKLIVAPTCITLRNKFAASTLPVLTLLTNRRDNLLAPHVQIIEMQDATMPRPGSMNLLAMRPSSNGFDNAWASMTLRAKRKVTEDTTVRIT